jgi:deoxyribonuclease-4
MRIGAHVAVSGGLAKAVGRGAEIGCEAIQIFNQSPRMWRPTAYGDDDFAAMREALEATSIDAVLIHAVYLLNCASDDNEIARKSLDSLVQSLRIGDGIGADGVVLHAGSAKTGDVAKAIARAGKVIKAALKETDSCPLHLENTAGAGGTLGRSFGELAALIDAAGADDRLGICLDSCHLLASGFEVRDADSLAAVLDECVGLVGVERLGSLHVNDSQAPFGSNVDRHAYMGDGEIGEPGLAVFLSEPRFEGLPCVLETLRRDRQSEDVALAMTLRKRGLARRRRK